MADKIPASEPFPGSRTPGWNDPPTLQYNPLATSGRTRLNLNKRVAFPLQGTTIGNTTAAAAAAKPTAIVPPNQSSLGNVNVLPPPMLPSATHPIAVVHPMPNLHAAQPVARVSTTELPADALDYALQALRVQVAAVEESPNVRRDEIVRRLGLIEQLWQSGNLSTDVQDKIYRLAKAVADKKYQAAMEIYTMLGANHSSECTTWAVALRHIILTLEPGCNSNVEPTTVLAATVTTHENSNIAIVPAMLMTTTQVLSNEQNSATTAGNNMTVQHI